MNHNELTGDWALGMVTFLGSLFLVPVGVIGWIGIMALKTFLF